MDISSKDSIEQYGYIKVRLNYAPKTNGKKFKEWCDNNGFIPMNSGRRGWSSSLGTYLRDASGIAYADGEPFLFYEEDLVDTKDYCNKAVLRGRIDELQLLHKFAQTNNSISTTTLAWERLQQLKSELGET